MYATTWSEIEQEEVAQSYREVSFQNLELDWMQDKYHESKRGYVSQLHKVAKLSNFLDEPK